MIVLCLLDTGCRASEFVALDIGDVDLDTGCVMVRCGKGGKDRVMEIARLLG
jgi:site-specific recombinase XerD